MGSDDLFKKRREARTQRKHEYKPPKANSYLIVTEGERTEPLLNNPGSVSLLSGLRKP